MTDALFVSCAFVLAMLLTMVVRRLALRNNIVDRPEADPTRKVHERPIPLLGGLSVWAAFSITVAVVLLVAPERFVGGYLLPKHLVGLIVGGLFLMLGGYLDDRYGRTPRQQILWPLLAALVVLASGIGIEYLSNPFGDAVRLDRWSVTLFTLGETPYRLVILADLFAFAWLLVSMYATKFLDGLDGLVSGLATIGMVILFFLSGSDLVGQPETALLALIGAASFAGFLVFNFHPAKIFLGEGGSLFAGFLLGTLAILSGGKIATALLILGIPLLDLSWVVVRRLFLEHRSPFASDKKHLHYRLLELGFSHRGTVLVLYLITAIGGSATLFVHGRDKVAVLGLLAVTMAFFAAYVGLKRRRSAAP